jgi:hypothetical protein
VSATGLIENAAHSIRVRFAAVSDSAKAHRLALDTDPEHQASLESLAQLAKQDRLPSDGDWDLIAKRMRVTH